MYYKVCLEFPNLKPLILIRYQTLLDRNTLVAVEPESMLAKMFNDEREYGDA